MNLDLIELQKGVKSTAVILYGEEFRQLSGVVLMNANVSNKFLYNIPYGKPVFKESLEDKAKRKDICYLVIKDLDLVDGQTQNRFIGLVKDREFCGYTLPNNCVVIFTVNDVSSLRNLTDDIYQFCIVA